MPKPGNYQKSSFPRSPDLWGDTALSDTLFAILSWRRTSQVKTQLRTGVRSTPNWNHSCPPVPTAACAISSQTQQLNHPRKGPAKPLPPPWAATCQHQAREMPASSPAWKPIRGARRWIMFHLYQRSNLGAHLWSNLLSEKLCFISLHLISLGFLSLRLLKFNVKFKMKWNLCCIISSGPEHSPFHLKIFDN